MSDSGDAPRVLSVVPSLYERPTRERTFMRMAAALADRSTCRRAHVGALVTDAEGLQVLGIGYNGAPRGLPNGCLRDEQGNCGCVHAEVNALLKAPGTIQNKVLYTTTAPCERCAAAILNGGVAKVIFTNAYRSTAGLMLLKGHVALSEM